MRYCTNVYPWKNNFQNIVLTRQQHHASGVVHHRVQKLQWTHCYITLQLSVARGVKETNETLIFQLSSIDSSKSLYVTLRPCETAVLWAASERCASSKCKLYRIRIRHPVEDLWKYLCLVTTNSVILEWNTRTQMDVTGLLCWYSFLTGKFN